MSRIQTVTPSNSTVIDRWTFVATYWSDVLAKTGLEASRSGAHQCLCWRQRIEYGRATSVTDLATREGVTDACVCRLLPLTCLVPDIAESVLRDARGKLVAKGSGTFAKSSIPLTPEVGYA